MLIDSIIKGIPNTQRITVNLNTGFRPDSFNRILGEVNKNLKKQMLKGVGHNHKKISSDLTDRIREAYDRLGYALLSKRITVDSEYSKSINKGTIAFSVNVLNTRYPTLLEKF